MKTALLFIGLAGFVLVGCKATTSPAPYETPVETQESMEGIPVDETMQVEPEAGEEGDPIPVDQDSPLGAPATE